jgi:hypothetical protein
MGIFHIVIPAKAIVEHRSKPQKRMIKHVKVQFCKIQLKIALRIGQGDAGKRGDAGCIVVRAHIIRQSGATYSNEVVHFLDNHETALCV